MKDVNHDSYIELYVPKEETVSKENEEESLLEEEEEDGEEMTETLEPLICAVDLECFTDENQFFKPLCAGWSYFGSDNYYEAGMVKEFLEDVCQNSCFWRRR